MGELVVAGVAHLNHGLRERGGWRRAVLPRPGGRRSACRFARISSTCAGARRSWTTSLEDAGRRARYELFERVADELEADVDRDGPHARRSGRDVPAAAAPRRRAARARRNLSERCAGRVVVIRPLLDVGARRAARVSRRRWASRFARTRRNADVSIPRNRVRHELLPLLERGFRRELPTILAARGGHRAGRRRPSAAGSNRSGDSIVLRNQADESVRIDASGR